MYFTSLAPALCASDSFVLFISEITLYFTCPPNIKGLNDFINPRAHSVVILGIILGVIGALIIAFFIIKYIRLTKRNVNLQEEMKSMAYSNNIQKNVLIKEKTERAQSDTDYETTFI